jgi:ABC-2 type transport system permease protein
MKRGLRHSAHVSVRYLRAFVRQPAWVVITLVQPMIWLLLFGALFKKVVEIPGFHGSSYIDFLMPGVVVMTAISSAGWNGMGLIDDMGTGVLDRFLVSPVWRGALNVGSLLYGAVTIAVQSLVIVAVAFALGAHVGNGVLGVVVLVLLACLLGSVFAALSNAAALVMRQRESLIGLVTSVMLPLTFLSSVFMQQSLAPGWIQAVARFNPVNWAVEASRAVTSSGTDWSLVASRTAFLAALLAGATVLATRAFGAYQRSL